MSLIRKETKKLFYQIGEVASELNVNVSLIRFWEKEFDIIKPKKNKKGNRQFSQKDFDNLKIIHFLSLNSRRLCKKEARKYGRGS